MILVALFISSQNFFKLMVEVPGTVNPKRAMKCVALPVLFWVGSGFLLLKSLRLKAFNLLLLRLSAQNCFVISKVKIGDKFGGGGLGLRNTGCRAVDSHSFLRIQIPQLFLMRIRIQEVK